MSDNKPKYIQELNTNRIHDGLLRDFIARGLHAAAIQAIGTAIEQRCSQIDFLEDLRDRLRAEPVQHDEFLPGNSYSTEKNPDELLDAA